MSSELRKRSSFSGNIRCVESFFLHQEGMCNMIDEKSRIDRPIAFGEFSFFSQSHLFSERRCPSLIRVVQQVGIANRSAIAFSGEMLF